MPVSASPRTAGAAGELDPERIRHDFPALHQVVNDRPLVYLDNAATTQKPLAVIEAVDGYYRRDNANVHRGLHELSRRATEAYEGARERVARWIGATDVGEVIWTRGATEAINLVASAWGSTNLREGDEILLTVQEHHSNLVPWQLLAGRTGATLRYLEIDEEGRLELDALPGILDGGRVRIAALSHASNALGTINPVAEIARQVHEAGALLLVDGAQGAAHHRVDVSRLGADFYAFSGHKMCGPTGVGILWGRRELLEAMEPYQGGGEMISEVSRDGSTWADLPHKFEAGTPNIAGAVGMAAALDYLQEIGPDRILAHEQALVARALDRLQGIDGIRLFGPADPTGRTGVVSFTMEGAHPHDIATILDAEGIALRAGHHCAQLVMKRYGVPATARASFYLYNTQDEVDRLVDGLGSVREIFGS
ncbi:MAG: cysteine desulfurase [Gemmatimonadota bacterium]